MKRDTRQEILLMAKELFNEKGFNGVSTRDIASALGISKGNLTYHFKKKEDIVEAILEELPGTPPPDTPKSLAELDAFFLNMQRVVQENGFYFWHHAQLSQLSPTIKEKQADIYKSNFAKLMEAFQYLQEDGLMRRESFEGEFDRVIDTLLLSSIYWMPFCQLKQEAELSYKDYAWDMIHHLLI